MKKLAILLLAIGCARQAPAPPPHSIRVVALGDSLAYGAGDESGKGIAGRLREALHADGIASVDTVNLGVNGADTRALESRLQKQRVREEIAKADAIVLSIGANDVTRQQVLRNPLQAANEILDRIQRIVGEIHRINPHARILILGGYNPVPNHQDATLINYYLRIWDRLLIHRFDDDRQVYIVRINDLVGPDQLSHIDNFHPSGAAYDEISKRIASMLLT